MAGTFDQVRELADRLAPEDRLRLATYLAQTTTAIEVTAEHTEAFRQRNQRAWQQLLNSHKALATDYPEAIRQRDWIAIGRNEMQCSAVQVRYSHGHARCKKRGCYDWHCHELGASRCGRGNHGSP